jgi:hypothetical protein
MVGAPLTAVNIVSRQVFPQWVGPGGDSLAIGHGAIWLTDYHKGTIVRLSLSDATSP